MNRRHHRELAEEAVSRPIAIVQVNESCLESLESRLMGSGRSASSEQISKISHSRQGSPGEALPRSSLKSQRRRSGSRQAMVCPENSGGHIVYRLRRRWRCRPPRMARSIPDRIFGGRRLNINELFVKRTQSQQKADEPRWRSGLWPTSPQRPTG